MKKAVDIVLLPPDNIMDICIELSRRAFERGENKLLRSKNDRLPHMSMMMGCMEVGMEARVIEKMEHIARESMPLSLRILEQDTRGGLSIEKTEELSQLHERLVHETKDLFVHDCDLTSLQEDPNDFDENSRIHVNDFIETMGLENFWPHITTHNQKVEDIRIPSSFTVERLALCHMGDHGTCRDIIFETTLGG